MKRHEEKSQLDGESREMWREIRSLVQEEGWCCKVIREIGLEGLQCETFDFRFHRVKLNYCPHCGKKL
jgi:hypothetical protein